MARTYQRLRRRLLAVCLLTCSLLAVILPLATPSSSVSQSSTTATEPARTVFISLGAMRWRDVSANTTPQLWELLHSEHTVAGSVVVRTTKPLTCPADAWLTLSAGQRASDTQPAGSCRPITSFHREGDWQAARHQAEHGRYGATLGTFADLLTTHSIPAAGIGPGAALTLIRSTGQGVSDGAVYPTAFSAEEAPARLDQVWQADPQLLMIDAAARIDDVTGLRTGMTPTPTKPENTIAYRVDRQLAAITYYLHNQIDADPQHRPIRLIAAGIYDRTNRPYLHTYLDTLLTGTAAGAPSSTVHLTSAPSTRTAGLVQLTDIHATLLAAVGVEVPPGEPGTVITAGGTTPVTAVVAGHTDLDQHTDRSRLAVGYFYGAYILLVLSLLIVVVPRLLTRSPLTWRQQRAYIWWATLPVTIPLAVYLTDQVPWWQLSSPAGYPWPSVVAVIVLILAVAGLLAAGACAAARRLRARHLWARRLDSAPGQLDDERSLTHPPVAAVLVAGALWLVLLLDAITGATVQRTALMGSFATVGGRFYGVNNTAFVLLLITSLTVAAGVAAIVPSRWQIPAVAAIGLVTVAVDGLPWWGADFGGPPALVPAFAVMLVLLRQRRIRAWHIGAVAAVTIAVGLALTVIDWLRPPRQRSHLGHLFDAVLQGQALHIVGRKLGILLDMLLSWPALIALVAAALAGGVIVWLLRTRSADSSGPWYRIAARVLVPAGMVRAAAIAGLIGVGLGFALNDSGPALAAIGFGVGIPILIARALTRYESVPEQAEA